MSKTIALQIVDKGLSTCIWGEMMDKGVKKGGRKANYCKDRDISLTLHSYTQNNANRENSTLLFTAKRQYHTNDIVHGIFCLIIH